VGVEGCMSIIVMLMFLINVNIFSDEIIREYSKLKKPEIPLPHLQTEENLNNMRKDIHIYTTKDIFPFEYEAKKECDKKINILKNFSIHVIGCNIIEKGNDYSYTIEYIPELKKPDLVPSIIINEYKPSKTYWNENLAKKELNKSLSRFQQSPLNLIDYEILEIENEYSFKILYIDKNILKKTKTYYVNFEKFTYGKYSFESEAKKNIYIITNKLKQKNIQVFSASVIENGNDYSIEIEYINKVDDITKPSKNPLHSISSYIAEEIFPFENNALNEADKRTEVFLKANMNVIHTYAYPKDNDWSFAIDYVVKNLYKNGTFVRKEYTIKRYKNPSNFDFESEAKKAMHEKINNFNNAGLYVVGWQVYESSGNYNFYIDYIGKD